MYQQLSYGGIDAGKPNYPDAYDRLLSNHGHETVGSFDQLLGVLTSEFAIEERPAMYGSTSDGGILPVNDYKVLVNPAWEGRDTADIPGDREDAVWNIPTSGYATVAHDEPLRSLRTAVIDRYGDDVFGATRLRREGAEAHTDLFLTESVLSGIEGEDLYLGISTGHDYTSTTKLYVDVIALLVSDGTARIMRYVTDPRKRKHTGDAEQDVVQWYGDALDRLDTVSDKLYRVIGDAMSYEIDMSEYPCSSGGFYRHLGLPDGRGSVLATPASDRLNTITPVDETATAWHFYKAGMTTIESEYESRDTTAFENHVTSLNTLLFNPSLAEKQVLSSLEASIVESREVDGSVSADVTKWAEGAYDDPLETVRTKATRISEGVAEFESNRDRIRTLLNDEGVAERDPETTTGD